MSKPKNRSKTIAFTFVFAIVMFISFIALFSISNVNVNALGITVSSDAKSSGSTYIANKGDSINIYATGSGGSNLTYKFEVQAPGTSTWKLIKNFSSSQQASYTFGNQGTFTFRATVRDGGSPPASQSGNIYVAVYDLENTSTVSSTQVTLGSNININAYATNGSNNYKYKYTYHKDGDNDASGKPRWFLILTASPDNFTSTQAVSFTVNEAINYTIKVTARDEKTYKTVEKTFNVKGVVDKTKITNTSTATTPPNNVYHPGDTFIINASASGGSGQYEYQYVIKTKDGTEVKTEKFPARTMFTYTADSLLGIFTVTVTARDKNNTSNTADKQFTMNIKEKDYNPIVVSGNIDKTQILTPNNSVGKDSFTLNLSAEGGTGNGYHYTYSYKKGNNGTVTTFGKDRAVSESDSTDSSSFTGQFKQTGTYSVRVSVTDSRNTVYGVKVFTVTVKPAPVYNKGHLNELLLKVNNWYDNLTRTQKTQFQALKPDDGTSKDGFDYDKWEKARNDAQEFYKTGNEMDTDKYYNELEKQDKLARLQELTSVEESEMFYQVNETIGTVMNFLLKGIGDMMVQNFGTTGPEEATIKGFDIQAFVDIFSPIFIIFANSLLVVLFGVNVLGTTLQYELFTLRGGAKLIGRLLLSKVYVDLSCIICMSMIKIASALLTEVVGKSQDVLYKVGFHFTFMYSSGIPVVGYVIDFLVMIIVLIILFLMFIPLLYFMIKVIIKLFVINFELAGLTAMSPAFFACLSGEETKQYFKNFIVTFLQILGELIFMGIVYAAFIMWYNTVGDLSLTTDISDMNIGGQVGNMITFAIVFIAACHLMVKPPEVFKNLIR